MGSKPIQACGGPGVGVGEGPGKLRNSSHGYVGPETGGSPFGFRGPFEPR